jgi:PIN domain nuclease of toxin-antitoxin system
MIVLDTQAWIWWLHEPSHLSLRARRAIQDAERTDGMCVSVISVWEIAVKNALGKLKLPMDMDAWFQLASGYPNLAIESVCARDAMASASLPGEFHRDPADRIIVAMSRRIGAPLVTSDALIRAYPHVVTIW